MLNATLKGLLAHKLRLGLTALAVVLGVGFVSGAFVLTDTLSSLFDKLFTEVNAGRDVIVRSNAAFQPSEGRSDREPMPEALLGTVRAVPGVADAKGAVAGFAQVVGKDGKAISTGGAPTVGFSWTDGPLSSLSLKSGSAPDAPTEVVIDAQTARRGAYKVGDKVKILLAGPTETFDLVGIAGFGKADNFGGATISAFHLPTAQRVLDRVGRFDVINVAADKSVSAAQLADTIAKALPAGYETVTGSDAASEQAAQVQEGLNFFAIALLVFAGVALFVGSFIIFNTFSIIVAQRTREFALLRALGASASQVLRSVASEALVTGVVSSVIGLGFGIVVAIGLQALLKAFGVDLPVSDPVIKARTVIVAMLVGTVVTFVASVVPARRASRVPPLAALRDSAVEDEEASPTRTLLGLPLATLGCGILALGLYGEKIKSRPSVVGFGAVVIFMAVASLAPAIAGPLSRVIGWPFKRFFKMPGKLARENASRSPRRTASTAAALMIGLALVTFVAVLASSVKSSIAITLDQTLGADYILTTRDGAFQGFSPQVAKDLAKSPKMAAVTGFRYGEIKLGGKRERITAANPVVLGQLTDLKIKSGNLSSLKGPEVFVYAGDNAKTVPAAGSTLTMEFARTGNKQFTVVGTFTERRLLGTDYLIAVDAYEANFTEQRDLIVLAKVADGVSPADSRDVINAAIKDFASVEVRDQTEFKAQQESQIDRLLGLVSVLLLLSIIIALVGITNTLALSVLERIRELGLLRAIGMSRRQVRSMIRWESVVIAVLGAVLGLPVGIGFAWAMVKALADQGLGTLTIPFGQLFVYVIAAGFAGVLAAVLPARRAARLNVLDAIVTE